jgi:hypothetical protein
LNEYAEATILSEEKGTRYEGFAAGSKQEITLKNSRLKIGIPRYHIFFPESGKQFTTNRGLLPQYTLEYSIRDLIHNIDRHLEEVLSLIEENKTATQSQ